MARDPGEDLRGKVSQALRSRNVEALVDGFEGLTMGKPITIDGQYVEALRGLGDPDSVDTDIYGSVIKELLAWGVRNFLVDPTYRGARLWSAMAMLDGPQGYSKQ